MQIKASLRKISKVVFPDLHFSSLLKWELRLLLVHLFARLSPFERAKIRALRKRTDLKINVGNGPFKHDSWVNIDCRLSSGRESLAFDLRRRWPIGTSTAQFLFSEHVFEHFNYPDDIRHILAECKRVLRQGGVLRIIVPDAGRFLRAYYEKDDDFFCRLSGSSKLRMNAVNKVFRENGFHKYAYDYEILKHLLSEAGFTEIQRSDFRESAYQELNLDFDEAERRLESLYVEAVG
jgi:predicted SAM-dependent methyltransferase